MKIFILDLLDNGFDELDFDLVKPEVLVEPLVVPRLRIVAHIRCQLRRFINNKAKHCELRKIALPGVIALCIGIEIQETDILSICTLACI